MLKLEYVLDGCESDEEVVNIIEEYILQRKKAGEYHLLMDDSTQKCNSLGRRKKLEEKGYYTGFTPCYFSDDDEISVITIWWLTPEMKRNYI